MKNVCIVKDWVYPDIIRQTPQGEGVWLDYKFTFDTNEKYDYLIVLNRNKHNINLTDFDGPKFLISQEPPIHQWHKHSFRYFDQVFTQHRSIIYKNTKLSQGALPWHIDKSYDELMRMKATNTKKEKSISCIASNINKLPGHNLRLNFINQLKKAKLAIDYFGRGCKEIDDKYDALSPYQYSIAIENSSYPHYWTEKIIDCYLSFTMPIYYGCTNLSDYFPEKSYVWIDINHPVEAVQKIKQTIESQTWKENIEAIAKARELILQKYQLFPFIVEKIENFNSKIKKVSQLSANVAPWEKKYSFTEKLKLKLLNYA